MYVIEISIKTFKRTPYIYPVLKLPKIVKPNYLLMFSLSLLPDQVSIPNQVSIPKHILHRTQEKFISVLY